MGNNKTLNHAVNKGKKVIGMTVRKVKKVHSDLKQRVGLGFWILLFLIFFLGYIYFTKLEQSMNYLIESYGFIGMFFSSFILDLLVQPIGPDLVIIFGIFSNLNPYLLILVVLLGSYLSFFTAYYLGERIGGAGIEKIVGIKTYKKIQNSPKYGKLILFFGAISPVPYVPYLAGVWKLSLKDVILIVIIPRTIRFIVVWALAYFLETNIFDLIIFSLKN